MNSTRCWRHEVEGKAQAATRRARRNWPRPSGEIRNPFAPVRRGEGWDEGSGLVQGESDSSDAVAPIVGFPDLPGSVWQIEGTNGMKKVITKKHTSTPTRAIVQTLSAQSSLSLPLSDLARAFPLPWSHYVLLISRSRSPEAFTFYQTEALRGGWSVRQLHRQMDSQFYERTALSRNKAAMLAKGGKARPGDAVSVAEEIRDPLVLEFLGLRDEYSESDLEEGLMRRRGEGREWHSVWVHAARAANSLNASRNREPVRLKNLPRPAQRGEADVRSAAGEGFDRVKAYPCPSPSPRCAGRRNRKVPGRRNSWITWPSQTVRLVREYLTALPKEELLSAELKKTRREIERRT